jgi:glycosyltransferase involved in cell wall biosynthesis
MADGPPTRVLWLTPDKPDNISVGRSRIAARLEQTGYDVTVTGTTPRTALGSLRDRGAYDVVVGTTRAGALAATVVATGHRIPLIVDHVDPIEQFERTHSRWLATLVRVGESVAFRRADHVLYVYEEEAHRVEPTASAATKTALGVDYHRFADPDPEILSRGRSLLNAEWERPLAVYIGGLEPLYHIEALLASAEHLQSGSIVLAGAGALEETVRQHAAETDRIHYLGSVDHDAIPGLLAECDVSVSLVDDPHTLKVLEYGAAGLPVVQFDGAARHRFGDRVVYTDTEPIAIAAAIERAVERDGASLQSFVRDFDWADIAATYAAAIEQVLSESKLSQ